MNTLKRRTLALVPVCLMAFSASALGAQAATATHPPLQGSLAIAGSNGMARLFKGMAKRFEQTHPQVKIDVQAVGSVPGLRMLKEGKTQIALLTRNLEPSERHLQSIAIARDGAAVIVNKSNPVSTLTTDQLRGIFLGRIRNWAEVGGNQEPILLFGPPKGFPVERQVGKYLGLDLSAIEFMRTSSTTAERIGKVSGATNAIHYLGLGSSVTEAGRGAGIKLISIDGVPPSPTAVRNNNYPLTRPLTLVTAGAHDRLTAEFIKYVLSPAVQDLITQAGFVTYLD